MREPRRWAGGAVGLAQVAPPILAAGSSDHGKVDMTFNRPAVLVLEVIAVLIVAGGIWLLIGSLRGHR